MATNEELMDIDLLLANAQWRLYKDNHKKHRYELNRIKLKYKYVRLIMQDREVL